MMNNIQLQAYQSTVMHYAIDEAAITSALGCIMQHEVDFADIYFQTEQSESWSLDEGLVKDAEFHVRQGIGVRAIHGEKTGFAYADVINIAALQSAAKTARSIAKQGRQGQVCVNSPSTFQAIYPAINPLTVLSAEEKVAILNRIDQFARQLDPRVCQVSATLAASHEADWIAGTDGTFTGDIRPLVRLNVTVIAKHNGRREVGFSGGGGRGDYTLVVSDAFWQQHTKAAVRQALLNLEAVAAPAGAMDVVLGNGWPGILLHEAIGHGLEGDFNRKGTSAFAKLMGQQVASPLCTVVDDGTLSGRRGSLSIDDEGTPSQHNVLIECGVLKNYMTDKLNAKLMNRSTTGNGRRESYADLPMPRMTNTYMLPGESDPQEIIQSVDKGLYAVNFSGGQVDITSGKFVFVVNEGYLIEKGRMTKPVKGATLIGDGPSALHRVTMVGNDLAFDDGIGICGKDGQNVPVGVGQPTLRINDIIVGGQS